MGLKVLYRSLYSSSNCLLRRADTGRGCRSSSSVGGGNFSGRISCLQGEQGWQGGEPECISEHASLLVAQYPHSGHTTGSCPQTAWVGLAVGGTCHLQQAAWTTACQPVALLQSTTNSLI
jgi:hypothetical protein